MRITASDTYGYYKPSKCGLRLFLKAQGPEGVEPGPYEQVIERLGVSTSGDIWRHFPVPSISAMDRWKSEWRRRPRHWPMRRASSTRAS